MMIMMMMMMLLMSMNDDDDDDVTDVNDDDDDFHLKRGVSSCVSHIQEKGVLALHLHDNDDDKVYI